MAITTISGGTKDAGKAVVDGKVDVNPTTKSLLNIYPIDGSGGVFLTGKEGTAASPFVVQGQDKSVFVVDGPGSVVQVGTQKDTFVIIDTTATVQGGSGSGTIIGGTGGSLLGTSTVTSSKYQLLGSLGNDTVIAAAGSNTITGGAGENIIGVFGGSNLVAVGAEGSNDTVIASGGVNTIFGGATGSLIGLVNGNNFVAGGAAAETIIAAGGASHISGGGGKDVFMFTKLDGSHSQHFITDFGVGGVADVVAIVGTGLAPTQASLDALFAAARVDRLGVTMDLGSNILVRFDGVTLDALRGNIVLG